MKRQLATEVLVLEQTDNYPKKLDGIVERICQRFRDIAQNEALRAIDFLESRDLLHMRTPARGGSKTLFMKKTDKVPDDAHERIRLLMRLHRVPFK
jgi:hypothetical protein